MKLLDIFLLLLLICGGYMGFKMGLIMELFSFISFSIAKVISIKLLHIFKVIYSKCYGPCGTITAYISFGIFFVITVGIILLLGKFFKAQIKRTALGKADRWIGAVLGIAKWGFYISTCIWLANLLGFKLPDSYIGNTILYPIIQVLSPTFVSWLSSWLPMLEKSIETLKHV